MNSDPPAAPTVRTAAEAAALLAPVHAGAGGHTVAVIHLDEAGRLLAIETCPNAGEGAHLPVRDILAGALRIDSRTLIVSRSLSRDDPTPSDDDVEATRLLASAARSLGLDLADYLIFAGGDCLSLREMGLL